MVTGDYKEEVMIFRYKQTLHHNIYIIITITSPKPAYGQQGEADHGAKIQIKQVPFGVVSTSHFAPPALSLDIN